MADQVKYTNKLKGAKVLVIGGSSGTYGRNYNSHYSVLTNPKALVSASQKHLLKTEPSSLSPRRVQIE